VRYIIGIGNYLMADDSIGLRIVEHVSQQGPHQNFEPVNIADDGMRLLFYLAEETEKIVLVDAVDLGLSPGEFRLFRPGEVESIKDLKRLTTHEGDILKVLELAKSLGKILPPITILGIQPERLEPRIEISPALQKRFDQYLQVVLEEIGKDG
jgi:hydrogenase maturation protease